jgi:glycerol dehydrogenase
MTMPRTIVLPRKYIQQEGLLAEAGRYLGLLGKRPLLLWGHRTREACHGLLLPGLRATNLEPIETPFAGECTRREAERIAHEASARGADVVVGLGGGKAIDAAKAAAVFAHLPVALAPTIASTDAPTSACTVWYDDGGDCVGFDLWPFNPDLILVDTGVIARAPVRYFVAGLGDALATWPEARAAGASGAVSCAGGVPTMTALTMARLCFETLMECGAEARRDVAAHRVTAAVERVVEATTLLSGIGWESGGLACAHAIANHLPSLPETHDLLHGEKVAFGLMCQLCLERGLDRGEVERIVDFMVEVGLPVTFGELTMDDIPRARIEAFAARVTAPGSFIHNHDFEVTAETVVDALFAADALGRTRRHG